MPSDHPPIWFTDIDGVIAPTRHAEGCSTLHDNGPLGAARYRPEITAALQDLHTSGLAEIHWLSTWEDLAEGWSRIGLGPFTIHRQREAPGSTWWKAAVVGRYLDTCPERRFVWVDDEIAWRQAIGVIPRSRRLLTICPDPSVGLTLDQIAGAGLWMATGIRPTNQAMVGPTH